jgi:hypothetical protein
MNFHAPLMVALRNGMDGHNAQEAVVGESRLETEHVITLVRNMAGNLALDISLII